MKDLLSFCKKAIKGNGLVYFLSYFLQLFMVAGTVFSSFLSKILVDALQRNLDMASMDPLSRLTVNMLSLGQGPQYIYDHMYVLPIALLISAAYIFLFAVSRMLTRFIVANAIHKRMQMMLYEHLVRLPYEEYKKQKSGDLIQCCTRDIDVIRRFIGLEASQLTYTFFIFVLCASVLASVSWKLFLVGTFLFPALFVYSFLLIKTVRRRYRAADDSEAMVMDAISNNLNAVRVVKAYEAENKEMDHFEEKIQDYEKKFVSWRRLSSFFFSSSDIFIFMSRTIAVLYALFLVFDNQITPGTAVIAYTFVNMMVWPMRDSAMRISNFGQTLASSDRVNAFLKIQLEDTSTGKKATFGDIIFDDVSFAYPDENTIDVLRHVSFSLKKGETLAILGKTGSGKSTIAGLLMRLYEPTGGKITVDGKDISTLSKDSLRKMIAPVLQDPFLFSKSVKDNIGIAMEDDNEETITSSAQLAQVEENILAFKEGYETPVGDKGVTLSGGQRQRLAIARALAAKREILLLDDSLSAVDASTDLAIRKGLHDANDSLITIIVTHRINTAKDANKIIVLDDGAVLEAGTHDELLMRPGLYRDIAKIQGVNVPALNGKEER